MKPESPHRKSFLEEDKYKEPEEDEEDQVREV